MGPLMHRSVGILSPGDIECVSSEASGKVPHLGLPGALKGKKVIVHMIHFLLNSLYKFKRTVSK